MEIEHAVWAAAASGAFAAYLADLNAIVDRDTRFALVANDYHYGRLAYRVLQAAGYVPVRWTLQKLHEYITDIVYKPRYDPAKPPIPADTGQTAGVLTCTPPNGCTVHVWRFEADLFVYIGELDETAHPPGAYVLVAEEGGAWGLPSTYITIP